MKIPTANIFIAYEKEVMDRLFYAGATYQNLVKEITEGQLEGLLLDNTSNPNFISFEHSHGMGSNFKMTLSFIDPKKQFERRYIGVSLLEALAGVLDSKSQNIKKDLTSSKDEVKDSQKEYKGGKVEKYKKSLQEMQGNRMLYVAYGVGDNLDLWSGPHVVRVMNASIDFKGARQVTIELVPTPKYLHGIKNRGAYREAIKANTYGLQSSIIGASQEIKFGQDIAYDITEYLDSSEAGKLGGKLKKHDFHTMVVDSIRSYVQKATNTKNVVVVLPDLNVVCNQAINERGRETGAFESDQGGSPGGSPGSYAKAAVSSWAKGNQTTLGRELDFVDKTLGSFGVSLKGKRRGPIKETSFFGLAGYNKDINKHKNCVEAFDKYFEDHLYFAAIDDEGYGDLDAREPLKKVFDNICRLSHESYKPSSFCYGLLETNSSILKNWGNNGKSYLLGGYEDFDENSAAVIVGDAALIKEYLYASEDLNEDGGQAPTGIPIHPSDKSILTNKDYNKLVREILNSSKPFVGPFGNISEIPDNFSYTDAQFTNREKLFIAKERIPVFRYNTKNPNVLNMKFKYGQAYYQALVMGFKKVVDRLESTKVGGGTLPEGVGSFPIRSRSDSISYAKVKEFSQVIGTKSKQKKLNGIAKKLSADFEKSSTLATPEEVSDVAAAFLDQMQDTTAHGDILVNQSLPGTPQSIMIDLMADLYKNANRMDIETLPMFHISQAYDIINNHCLLFAQDQEISQSNRVVNNPMSQFHSGIYNIIGFKHVISRGNISSSFSLVKTRTSVD